MSSRRQILKKIAALFVGFFLSLVLLEVALRVIPNYWTRGRFDHIPHPVLGWINPPNCVLRCTNPDFDVIVT